MLMNEYTWSDNQFHLMRTFPLQSQLQNNMTIERVTKIHETDEQNQTRSSEPTTSLSNNKSRKGNSIFIRKKMCVCVLLFSLY